MNPTIDRTPLLRVIGPPLRKLIRQHYSADSCIASTRIGLEVLELLGIQSAPLTAQVVLFNRQYVAHVESIGRLPDSVEERETWHAELGAHSVGLGVPTKNTVGMHVVLIVEGKWLWDLSIDQASRPEQGILIDGPVVFDVTPEFLSGAKPRHGTDPSGAIMIYTARPGVDTYATSPNWLPGGRDAPLRARIVDAALEAIVQAVKARPTYFSDPPPGG